MTAVLEHLVTWIDRINTWIGESAKWLNTALVLLIFTDVLLRYLFSHSQTWIIELEWHMFALIFLLGAAYAFKEEQHVRVDVFFARWPEKRKALVDLIGTVVFLLPWCALVIYTSFDYAHNALSYNEGSPDPGGLPARYVIKFAITLGFALLLLQGIVRCLRALQTLMSDKSGPWKSSR